MISHKSKRVFSFCLPFLNQITFKIKNAAALLDIQVLDHIIVSIEGFFSFADEGLI
jgi:DNA repair protein RadC